MAKKQETQAEQIVQAEQVQQAVERPQNLQSALRLIQAYLRAPKDKFNSFGNYAYRSAEGILEAVKPLLNQYECILTISDTIEERGSRFYVVATATIRLGEEQMSVSAYAREDETKPKMDGAQITGAASSYARKYALNGLFLIDDSKDPDIDEYSKQQQGGSGDINGYKKRIADASSAAEIQGIWDEVKSVENMLGKEAVKELYQVANKRYKEIGG